jgi:hypothetical protein
VTVAHPLTGQPESFTLTRDMVLGAVRGPLYQPAIAAALPQAIDDAAQRPLRGAGGLNSLFGRARASQLAMGMHFSVVCAEDVPRLASHATAGPDFGSDFATLYERSAPTGRAARCPALLHACRQRVRRCCC